jgi:hypothetical protein
MKAVSFAATAYTERFMSNPPCRIHRADRQHRHRHRPIASSKANAFGGSPCIDRQSDGKYGRGISHISADLNEGDIIAYQDGTWYVDGTEVGDGSAPRIRYLIVDTIQLVWTHDCEHGVINGFDLLIQNGDDSSKSSTGAVEIGSNFIAEDDYVQVGPEQILARIPAVSMNENSTERDLWSALATFYPDDEMITLS